MVGPQHPSNNPLPLLGVRVPSWGDSALTWGDGYGHRACPGAGEPPWARCMGAWPVKLHPSMRQQLWSPPNLWHYGPVCILAPYLAFRGWQPLVLVPAVQGPMLYCRGEGGYIYINM